MTVEEIGKIIAQGESVSIEVKKAKGKMLVSLYKTVICFANTKRSYILLGVEDDRMVLDIQSKDKVTFLSFYRER